jgi:hypothetical protein
MLTLDAFSEAHQSCESGESAGRAADSFELFINLKSAMALGLKDFRRRYSHLLMTSSNRILMSGFGVFLG